jgi:hypothetical protein
MDISRAFGFVFEDEEWVSKVLIGGLILLIPFVGQLAALGYMIKVGQNVAAGKPRPLPPWNEFGEHLMRGLYDFVIRLVYSLPIAVLAILYACGTSAFAGGISERNARAGGSAIGLLTLCFVPLMIVLGIATALVLYAALARFVATNSLSEALKFAEVIAGVRRNVMPWVMMLLVSILAGFVGGLGIIACGVGMLFTLFYAQCVIGHALGQTVAQQGMVAGGYPSDQPPSYGPPPTY